MLLFVDDLTNVDFSYLHPQRGIVGETWLASIELEGILDEQGMICDFGVVKKMVRNWLDTELDHRLLIPNLSSALSHKHTELGETAIRWTLESGQAITCKAPSEAITLADTATTDMNEVAQWCISKLTPLFPSSVKRVGLTFKTENMDSAPFYHYSHGLKKHDGNCQRIAHGHRSRIEIWRNDQLDKAEMKHWADLWQDIYIGTAEDVTSQIDGMTHFAYTSQQGNFEFSIPTQNCYIMQSDTTVEFIAQHIAESLAKKYPADSIRVKAYEGLGKGAIACAN